MDRKDSTENTDPTYKWIIRTQQISWIQKMCYLYNYTHTHTHTHTIEYYSAIKKSEILLFVRTLLNLEGIMLSEISLNQTEKDKYCMLLLIRGI